MRSLFLPVTCFLAASLSAQSWSPSGAQWIYGLESGDVQGYSRFHYQGDTVLNDTAGQRIGLESVVVFFPDPAPVVNTYDNAVITSYANDVVSVWSALYERWDTLMWFGANVGDHWLPAHYEGECGEEERILVDATGTETVDGGLLRWLELANGRGRVMERAGWYWNLELTPSCLVVEGLSGMRCYTDWEVSYTPEAWGQDCFVIGMEERQQNARVLAFPDPGSSDFSLVLPDGAYSVQLIDAFGRIVLNAPIGTERMVDAHDPSPGIYSVIATSFQGVRLFGRWVKE